MNATDLVIEILQQALTVPVLTDLPRDEHWPSRCVMVDLSGDQSDEFILRPQYDLTCWGTSDRDAQVLAFSAAQAINDAAPDHPYLSACQLESVSREEWSRNGQGRYRAIVALVINTD